VKPVDIQVMKKERICNTFKGEIIDNQHVRFLDTVFRCDEAGSLEEGADVKVLVDFGNVTLFDNEEEGALRGVVSFILYKGNYYHLTISTGENEHIFVDTNDIWDDGDRVGISISPEAIHLDSL
jgi:spermidine/putrescine transport system ATP-binding protein